jgi:hypothetical protein
MSRRTAAKRGLTPAELKRALPRKVKRAKAMRQPRVEKPKTHASESMKLELEHLAQMLMKSPDGMSKHQYWEIANYLRWLARTPAAMNALMRRPKGRGRPAKNASRDWKMSLDYDITMERLEIEKRGNSKRAENEICAAYKVGSSVMFAAHKACAANPQWREWAEYERKAITFAHPNHKGPALLTAFSNLLREPEPTPGLRGVWVPPQIH